MGNERKDIEIDNAANDQFLSVFAAVHATALNEREAGIIVLRKRNDAVANRFIILLRGCFDNQIVIFFLKRFRNGFLRLNELIIN